MTITRNAAMQLALESLQKENDELRKLLQEGYNYVGYAACHGDKCRLPHCVSCLLHHAATDLIKSAREFWEERGRGDAF